MKRDAVALAGLLHDANVKAFLAVIRAGEGTSDPDGYRRHFGGSLFESFDDHPRKAITAGLGRNQYTSTAAGAYQFLSRTWDGLVRKYGFANFTPFLQDVAALALIDGRNALDDVLAGRFEDAVRKCAPEWASLPGSPYGQPTKTLPQAIATYKAAGGAFAAAEATASTAPETTPGIILASPTTASASPEESTMPLAPILAAVLPSIVSAIPALGKLFGSGSDVAERNVKAAEIAVGIVQEAVGARNAQEAAEVIAADPAQAQAAREAVSARWMELTEAGGDGIAGARKADAAAMGEKGMLHSPSFWIAAALLPLVYMIVGSVVGLFGVPWSDDVRSAIANGVVGMVLGSIAGYYFGQTTSRNRTPAP